MNDSAESIKVPKQTATGIAGVCEGCGDILPYGVAHSVFDCLKTLRERLEWAEDKLNDED